MDHGMYKPFPVLGGKFMAQDGQVKTDRARTG